MILILIWSHKPEYDAIVLFGSLIVGIGFQKELHMILVLDHLVDT